MPLVSGKCPQCGANLKINDQAKGELTCPYCGSLYLVEQAIEVTNITNNTTNNISAENVVINGFDEKKELEKARALIGKDDNLASRIYENIFINNPENYEAQYLRIILNKDTKSVSVSENNYTYNSSLKMYVTDTTYHQEDQPLYKDSEKNNARDMLLKKALELNDEKIKPTLRKVFPIKYLIGGTTEFARPNCYFIPNIYDYNILLFLYDKDKVKEELLKDIDFYYGDGKFNYYLNADGDIVLHLESLMTKIDPTYTKRYNPLSSLSNESVSNSDNKLGLVSLIMLVVPYLSLMVSLIVATTNMSLVNASTVIGIIVDIIGLIIACMGVNSRKPFSIFAKICIPVHIVAIIILIVASSIIKSLF